MASDIELGQGIIFHKKIVKQGKNFSIFVPKDLINEGLIDPDGFYEVTLRRVRKKEKVLQQGEKGTEK